VRLQWPARVRGTDGAALPELPPRAAFGAKPLATCAASCPMVQRVWVSAQTHRASTAILALVLDAAALQLNDCHRGTPGASRGAPRQDRKAAMRNAHLITVRLHVDNAGHGWALVRCNACTDVDKYPALAAFDGPIRCKCGETMTVRRELMAAIQKRPNPVATLDGIRGNFALA
jgi:hypothetical protein